MTRNATPPRSAAPAAAVDRMRREIEDLNQRIGRQEKRVQRIQIQSSGRTSREPGPAAETQAALADMMKQRDAMLAELKQLEAQQNLRTD